MFSDGGRKPEYPEKTHAYLGRTCKLHTERTQPGFEPRTVLLRGKFASLCSLKLQSIQYNCIHLTLLSNSAKFILIVLCQFIKKVIKQKESPPQKALFNAPSPSMQRAAGDRGGRKLPFKSSSRTRLLHACVLRACVWASGKLFLWTLLHLFWWQM